MSALRKNVASQTISFTLVNASSGAALTGATLTGSKWMKDGVEGACAGTFAEPTAASGRYTYTPTQAETNCTAFALFPIATGAVALSLAGFTTAGDPTNAINGGWAGIPNVVAGANGGLPTGDAAGKVALQADQAVNATKIGGTVQTARDLGANIDATVSSRLAGAAYTAPDNADIVSMLADVTAGTTTIFGEVGAIKAKTDNLPASPAAVGSAMTLTSGERNSVADALLNRDLGLAAGASAASRFVIDCFRALRNKVSIAGTTLTVTTEDDVTSAWTAAVTSSAGANPITGIDPV